MVYLSQEIGEFGKGKNSRAGRGKGRLNSRAARRGKGGKERKRVRNRKQEYCICERKLGKEWGQGERDCCTKGGLCLGPRDNCPRDIDDNDTL